MHVAYAITELFGVWMMMEFHDNNFFIGLNMLIF